MTYTVVWLPEAMTAFRQLRTTDPVGVKRVASAVSALASNPRPGDISALGGTSFRRLRLDNHRVLYEVSRKLLA